uniref:Uncharacterized protein n=1 Tax=Tanacetum cinerariifolium TaxID=118510 RepID=A0A6L2L608_TANCI|nr:hypothetical protein [Tanacetum cinerariifolium]
MVIYPDLINQFKMTTLVEFMIIAGMDNHPPMLENLCMTLGKVVWNITWRIGRMILNSVQNGPLIWPTVREADSTTRTKKYEELYATKKIQADCDCKATNIVLQGLPPDMLFPIIIKLQKRYGTELSF